MNVMIDEKKQRWLNHALQELKECDDEAREEDLSLPSERTKKSIERILRAIFLEYTVYCSVYPSQDKEIHMSTATESYGYAFMIVCHDDNRATVYLTSSKEHLHRHYDDASSLPDDFVWQALEKMKKWTDNQEKK